MGWGKAGRARGREKGLCVYGRESRERRRDEEEAGRSRRGERRVRAAARVVVSSR